MRMVNPGDPVYAPNSAGGPEADPSPWRDDSYYVAGEILRSANTLHAADDDFVQPRALWEGVLTETDREHLVHNITVHAGAPEVTPQMRERVVDYWTSVHPLLGAGVSKGLISG
jgi:catalase